MQLQFVAFGRNPSSIYRSQVVLGSTTRYPVQAGECRLPCTVGLGTGLPCQRLSAGCWFRTENPAVRRATCLHCATSEQHFRRSIICGCRSTYMEWAAFQSTWHCMGYRWLLWMPTWRHTYFPQRLRSRHICDCYDFFALHLNVLTYLLTYY